ncbi:VQ motif-containing protein 8, chloroplastic-like [Abrus precatorius]|uniref:VQ motif-containing protein 8, chloroplastic-like n=1 Tax=Abrus precatorius TaxID=3816 RepID=A0A8B8M6I5_ABRPR|nr:VQ motif-containing protein 8, chloroplastic-like [Abrus precatorius]
MRTATARFHSLHEHSEKVVINDSRPSPLMINKHSHLIRKPPSSSSSFKSFENPIIIYTESPKVFHTKPRDFMALVQRLTGITHSNQDDNLNPQFDASENYEPFLFDRSKPNISVKAQAKEQNVSCAGDKTNSALRESDDEICVKQEPFVQHSYCNLGFADVPLFTPTSVYKYSDTPFGFLGSLLSPSGLEVLRELPEY